MYDFELLEEKLDVRLAVTKRTGNTTYRVLNTFSA
jgi:hypothetical protein